MPGNGRFPRCSTQCAPTCTRGDICLASFRHPRSGRARKVLDEEKAVLLQCVVLAAEQASMQPACLGRCFNRSACLAGALFQWVRNAVQIWNAASRKSGLHRRQRTDRIRPYLEPSACGWWHLFDEPWMRCKEHRNHCRRSSVDGQSWCDHNGCGSSEGYGPRWCDVLHVHRRSSVDGWSPCDHIGWGEPRRTRPTLVRCAHQSRCSSANAR